MTALEFAINMENDGQEYYSRLAQENKGNKLGAVFALLADEEKKHADILQTYAGSASCSLEGNPALSDVENVFAGIEYGSNAELKMYIEQTDVYRDARDTEKQSIEFYKKMLSEATDAKEKELFAFLVSQEQEHFSLMDELVSLLDRSKRVVSSGSGMTDDY